MNKTKLSKLIALFLFLTFSIIQVGCKQSDGTQEPLKTKKTLMIDQPSKAQDSITYLLSNFFTDFIPESSNPKDFKYYSEMNGNKFLLLVNIDWINTQPIKDQQSVMRVVPMVLDLNEELKSKEIYVGIYGKKGIAIVKTPEGEFYSKNANQNLLMEYFKI